MFQSFTGSSRRPRQVNLSGRNANPFAAASTIGTGAGSQAALASAQQERLQRQRDRERLSAARKLQRVWRGHAARKWVRQELRREWDAQEEGDSVAAAGNGVHKAETETDTNLVRGYADAGAALRQAQRLTRFLDWRLEDDVKRLRHFAMRLSGTVQSGMGTVPSGRHWQATYTDLEKAALAAVGFWGGKASGLRNIAELLQFINFLVSQVPRETARDSRQYYEALLPLLRGWTSLNQNSEEGRLMLEVLLAPLQALTADTLAAYDSFACTVLCRPEITPSTKAANLGAGERQWLLYLADKVNYKLLANSLATNVKTQDTSYVLNKLNSNERLRLLGHFIYFHRHTHNFRDARAYTSSHDFVTVVSALLTSVSEELNLDAHIHDSDESFGESPKGDGTPTNEFVKQQLLSLIDQDSVRSLLTGTRRPSTTDTSDRSDEARQLASYALTLLRIFPKRGDEIRMWLYLGSATQNTSQNLPAIKYFWKAAKSSGVFTAICAKPRSTIDFFKPKRSATTSATFGWQPPGQTQQSITTIDDEWRVILIFFELYTFVLKVMDDEEFFSANDSLGAPSSTITTSSSRPKDNALPLDEVTHLITFLKNLGFVLYFYASEIAEPEESISTADRLSTYFTLAHSKEPSRRSEKEESKIREPGVAGAGVEYIKGLVTGLLRMIYERDSRRKFVPADHWLMTSKFDMEAFIPAVVKEEESRHQIQEEDDEEEGGPVNDWESDRVEPLVGFNRAYQLRVHKQLQSQQRKASRRRYLDAVAPRLKILQNMPFFIPFKTRVEIFRNFVHLDKVKRRGGTSFVDPDNWRMSIMNGMNGMNGMNDGDYLSKHHAKIRRGREFEDAYKAFYELKDGLKEPIQITFVDKFDTVEAGIDGGGVTKEFLTSVTSKAFEPSQDIDLFVENEQHLLYPNPGSIDETSEALNIRGVKTGSSESRQNITLLLQQYEFLGRIMGKCLYEGILVDVNFAPFFLLKWALTGGTGSAPKESGYRANLNDVRDLDEQLYHGLLQLKNYPEDVEDFSLNFTISDTLTLTKKPLKRKTVTRDLRPGGSAVPVTNENRLLYISYVARYRLQIQPYAQTNAFLRGLSTIIQPSWLSMFNQSELQTLIGGTAAAIDVDDLRRNTLYGGVYVIGDDGMEHDSVVLFWRVMRDFSPEERAAVLKFVTSTPRAPLLGFASLNPRFSIRDAGNDQTRLPSTSTCVNLLKLPRYNDEGVLREKLRQAVFSGAGFDLS